MRTYDLQRFIDVQDYASSIYEYALNEVSNGHKSGHWIWYIFPQIAGLGSSSKSVLYALADIDEATCYLNHPILGYRLREITTALIAHSGKEITSIFGEKDCKKVHACMTLFDNISPNDIFADVLDAFFAGKRHSKTLALIKPENGDLGAL